MSLGLYLHIPYCFSKCRYCDFYSAPGQRGVPRAYVDALLRGAFPLCVGRAPAAGHPLLRRRQPQPARPRRRCPAHRRCSAPAGAEITLEANPETVTEASLQAFRAAGVNRISFGVQSARDSQLKTLGRPTPQSRPVRPLPPHAGPGSRTSAATSCWPCPHYTQAEFDETLELIEEGGATHISAYLLKDRAGLRLWPDAPGGSAHLRRAADFYLYAVEQLEHHGYLQYEISNFARPGYEGKHNLIYWDCGDYLGIGPPPTPAWAANGSTTRPTPKAFLRDEAAPVMDGGCGAEDYLILQLRLRKGPEPRRIQKRYGREFSTAQLAFVQNCVKSGYASFDGHTLAPHPAGLIVQNSILAELL